MRTEPLDHAIELLEKTNADLEPELLTATHARKLLASYAKIEKLAAFGVAALTRKVSDSSEIARVTGTSAGKAEAVVRTGRAMGSSADLSMAMQTGSVSLEQASEISKAEEAKPGAAAELLRVARDQAFHVLKEKARKVRLEAEQHRDLALRQREARAARSYSDELGMVHVHLAMEPHVGTPGVAGAAAAAARLGRKAKSEGRLEPFERHLVDAYAALLAGNGKGRAKRPELVVLVSLEVAQRGWTDVRAGEVCKIPGVGPVEPHVAQEIGRDAFLSGVLYDGKDLRQLKRWSRAIPAEVAIALELGEPPDFDGVACVDCGNRFRTEFDHVQPRCRGGPTSAGNLRPRCWSCHQAKSKRERMPVRAGARASPAWARVEGRATQPEKLSADETKNRRG
jgi:5-methylcytosine-specific restriction endonuclease McrA